MLATNLLENNEKNGNIFIKIGFIFCIIILFFLLITILFIIFEMFGLSSKILIKAFLKKTKKCFNFIFKGRKI